MATVTTVTTPTVLSWRPTTTVAAVLITITALAWALLLIGGHLGAHGAVEAAHGHGHHHSGGQPPASTGFVAALTGWALMTVAMMTPGLIPAAQSWRLRTLRRRWWAAPTVAASYYVAWLVAGAIAIAAVGRYRPTTAVVVGMLLIAAAWQLTPVKRWALVTGHRNAALHLRGWKATGSELRCGARQGSICTVSCWAVMAPMVTGAAPMGVLMLVGTVAVTAERLSATPRRARQFGAALLAATAIGIGALSLT